VHHVVWDWNGTLLDDLGAVVAAVNVSLARLGAAPIDEVVYRHHYTRPVRRFYESLLGRAVGDREMAEIDHVFHEAYQPLAERLTLGAEARRAVEAVHAEGATQSVLSMWWHESLEAAVRRMGLAEYMVAVDGTRGGAPGREKSGHLVEHLERLAQVLPGVGRASIVMIGDITDDADAAEAAGIGCVLYDGRSQPRSALEERGVPVAGTLVEALALAGVTAS
jgi:phosphoglycolate phosphatase-like HAD superfamily hydrolase